MHALDTSLPLPFTSVGFNPARPLRVDRSRHVAPQVFDRLREMILSMELAPGAVLCRADLAVHFGISQTPVRDALMRLGEEGLVDIFPQHATMVSQIRLDSARQAHFLRLAIELEVTCVLAGHGDPLLISQLRAQIGKQREMQKANDLAEFLVFDQNFHRLMYEAAGVAQLWDIVRRLSGHLDRLRRLHLPSDGKVQAIVSDHTELVDAIENRDVDEAQRVLRRHLSGTLSQIEQIRRSYPSFVILE